MGSRVNSSQSHLLEIPLRSYRTTSSQDISNIQKESSLIRFETESNSTLSEKMSHDKKSQRTMKNTTKVITKKSRKPRRLQNDKQRKEQLLIKGSVSREMMKLLQEERHMDVIKQEDF